MRFKSIFWLFNIVVLLALIIFTASSFFLFGKDYATAYLGNMWIVIVLFLILIGTLNFYFLRNWKLFDLLEKEDWPNLQAWLEKQIYTAGKLNRAYAALLVNTALSLGKMEVLEKLENEIRAKKPSLLISLGVSLGIPKLSTGDSKVITEHFSTLADNRKTNGQDWARWCRSMAAAEQGNVELIELLSSSDASVRLLSYKLLSESNADLSDEARSSLNSARPGLKKDLIGVAGEKALLRSRENHIMAVVMTSATKEAQTRLEADA